MKLREYLYVTGIKLTDLEKKTMNAIRSQGSYYEESLGLSEGVFDGQAFLGWEIYESEVPGCRGALASLVKKGIITIDYQEGMAAYYVNYELEFNEDDTINFII